MKASYQTSSRLAKAVGLAVTTLLVSQLSAPVQAQQTASSVGGVVTDAQGAPLAGSTVIVRDETTGQARQVETNAQGQFLVRNLPVGTEYTVEVSNSGYRQSTTEDVVLNLGQTTDLDFMLSDSGGVAEELVVSASRDDLGQFVVGPSATFGLQALDRSPAINRNITDVMRMDARLFVDESRGDINSVQCAGKNPRFNSLTVDGVRMNDSFGLNDNGYPTERMPFSYDAIKQVSVELAPFDVRYGGFTACNINTVTKSGSNDFYGGAFFDYTDDGFRGDTLEGDDIVSGEYDEKRFGFNVGGRLIEDKLFFFAAYEKLEGANLFDRGALGSGAVNEVNVTQAEIDEILDISRNIYQYDPGTIPSSLGNEDEKFLAKLDWYISDNARLAFTYNYNDGNNFTESDDALNELEFSNHLYEKGAELNSYVVSLYNDWTDRFSTEIRFGYLELDNTQRSVGGNDFGEIRVELDNVDVYLGGDDSRQSNKLDYDVDTIALRGSYYMDNGHSLTFGYEREALEVFNLFVQHTETEIRFDGIDDFRDGFASAIYYNNAPSNNPEDAAAVWGYEVNTAYLQDEFDLNNGISLVLGLRYDWYTSDDVPVENPDFVASYGFSNATNLDGEGLIQPRLGFTWDYADDLTFRGGIGRFSGGNPNVWLSNNFSANNVLQFGQRGRSFGYTDGSRSLFDANVVYLGLENGVPAGPGYGIPSELYNAVAGGTGDNFEINYLDPDFELPSEMKYSAGLTWFAPVDFVINLDFLFSKADDTAIVLRGDLEQIGTTTEGYPIYDSVREPAFVLTNSREGDRSVSLAGSIAKDHGNGFDWMLGYAWSDAEDVQPMNSAVAFSNYTNRAFFDPQEQVLSTSNYNIEHRFTASFNLEKYWFSNLATRFSLFASYNSGVPYSITFDGTIDPYNFTPYLDFQPLVLEPGRLRNEEEGSWWAKADLRIEQEIPGFTENSNGAVFLVVDNLTNLINDEWGILRKVNFPNNVELGDQPEARIGDASRYEIRLGLEYNF